jgi:hypothetical protein
MACHYNEAIKDECRSREDSGYPKNRATGSALSLANRAMAMARIVKPSIHSTNDINAALNILRIWATR